MARSCMCARHCRRAKLLEAHSKLIRRSRPNKSINQIIQPNNQGRQNALLHLLLGLLGAENSEAPVHANVRSEHPQQLRRKAVESASLYAAAVLRPVGIEALVSWTTSFKMMGSSVYDSCSMVEGLDLLP